MSEEYKDQQFLFDKASKGMEITDKNRYIKCISSDQIAYATGKIQDDPNETKTSYTIKLGCKEKANVVVGITTQEDWINSTN